MCVKQVAIIATEYVRDFKIEESMWVGGEHHRVSWRPYQRRTFRASDPSHINGRTHGGKYTHTGPPTGHMSWRFSEW